MQTRNDTSRARPTSAGLWLKVPMTEVIGPAFALVI